MLTVCRHAAHDQTTQTSNRWLCRVRRMEDGQIPENVLCGKLASGKRSVGRPQLQYKDVCKRDLKALDINTDIITDRHPNSLFSVCIISPNTERKIMQSNCVRKTGAVFFGSREIIRGNLKRAKSTRSIIKPKTSCIIRNNAARFSFNNAACFTCIYPLPHIFFY